MVRHTKVRLAACVVVVGLTALGASSVAGANTISGAQDPNAKVTVSITSSGANPNVAMVGDEVRAFFQVSTSNVFQPGFINMVWFGDWAGTKLGFTKSKLVKMKAGKTWDWEVKFRVRPRTPAGTFSLFGIAETASGPPNAPDACGPLMLAPLSGSCAVASIEVGMAGADLGASEYEIEDDNDKTDE